VVSSRVDFDADVENIIRGERHAVTLAFYRLVAVRPVNKLDVVVGRLVWRLNPDVCNLVGPASVVDSENIRDDCYAVLVYVLCILGESLIRLAEIEHHLAVVFYRVHAVVAVRGFHLDVRCVCRCIYKRSCRDDHRTDCGECNDGQ
jgi:hypothetical protein